MKLVIAPKVPDTNGANLPTYRLLVYVCWGHPLKRDSYSRHPLGYFKISCCKRDRDSCLPPVRIYTQTLYTQSIFTYLYIVSLYAVSLYAVSLYAVSLYAVSLYAGSLLSVGISSMKFVAIGLQLANVKLLNTPIPRDFHPPKLEK